MTNEKKITLLENLLNERDTLIEKLQRDNAQKEEELKGKIEELDGMMDDHENLVNALDELKENISIAKEKQLECNELIKELKLMKKQYRKDMDNILSKLK